MARDSGGRGGRSGARRKPQAASRSSGGASPWRWFAAGVGTGVFLSLLLYLGTLPPGTQPAGEAAETAAAEAPPKPRFDFYTMLPEQTIDVEVEPTEVAQQPNVAPPPAESYVLQAGSFRQREDADRRRAELLLLGLEPSVEESTGDNGRWFRVYLGPYTTHAQMSRARGLTAAQNIDTLLLKRGRP
ncbi:MAG: sporulation protein [Haliea sp.]|uniref:SPOR domain-containing protein n=1 Tax=Haliea sp. TaxID=1932666 RepID=UPI000C4267D1|nr:SPOR domain-containing protein [Haliea sp.]MBM69187.1 sporulation protein [Haliea sp.]|tara:strand:+ start:8292 stop:8852 length:561 start_codon:yes stop_codon:yes gene_type:complete